MAQPSDLTTLANVKAWLGIATGVTTSDALLSLLITSVSRGIYSKLQRPSILPSAYTETRSGGGETEIVLNNWPVTAVASLAIGGVAIQASPALVAGASWQNGYTLDPPDIMPPGRMQGLSLRGHCYWPGTSNVVVSYTAGYQVAETQTIAAGALTALAPYGVWAADQGVAYALTGAALTKVASAPAVGQYAVTAGAYTFSAADNGASVALTYGYIPADLAQAAMEWVATRFRSKDNIGYKSKSLGGQETVTYDISAVPMFVASLIQPYMRITAC